jgi:hypothetical protein
MTIASSSTDSTVDLGFFGQVRRSATQSRAFHLRGFNPHHFGGVFRRPFLYRAGFAPRATKQMGGRTSATFDLQPRLASPRSRPGAHWSHCFDIQAELPPGANTTARSATPC